MSTQPQIDDPAVVARKARLSVLARAPADRVKTLWAGFLDGAPAPEHDILRPAEIGTVMVRGRAGGNGAAFNLGEVTVTRCTIRLIQGAVGHGHIQGRDREAALAVALIDAVAQAGQGAQIDAAIVSPLRNEAQTIRHDRAAKAAATKVEFFTMVRGEG